MKKLTVQPNEKSRHVAVSQIRRHDEDLSWIHNQQTRSSGQKITLRSNHFIMKTANDQPFYQYQVDYDPPIDNQLAEGRDLREIVGQTRVFDGMVKLKDG